MTQRKSALQPFGVVLGIVLFLTAGLWAQNSPGVARISYLQGEISMLRQGDTAWTSAALNTPLVSGDEIYVAESGRAELELDANDAIRLAGNSDLRISRFFGRDLQLQLRTGTLSYTAGGLDFLPAEIETPNMSVRPLEAGVLRIDVVDATHTSVTVWHGRAEVFAANGRVEVAAGQQLQIQGETENAEYQTVAAPELDAWDQWVQQREDRVRSARSYRYMSRDIYGGEDLDSYGNWVTVPNYGSCWQPTYFVSDWSPYYYGRWLWNPFYGWTWASYEPWGWAPYHFGRWFWTPHWGWLWWPGSRFGHPIWAPAFVNFFFGAGNFAFGLGFGPGVVGWVPLAPFEPFFGFSRARFITHGHNITIINNTFINNTFIVNQGTSGRLPVPPIHLRNASAPGGFVVVSSETFANGRVDQGGRFLTPAQLRGFHPIHGTPPVIPTARSLQPLPGRVTLTPPTRIARVRVFHRPQATPMPVPRTMTLSQITQSMQRAQRTAGLAMPGMTRPGRIAPSVPAGRMPVPSGTLATPASAGVMRVQPPGVMRIQPPIRPPASLSNEGPRPIAPPPARIAPVTPAPQVGQPQGAPGWRRFGNTGPMPGQPVRPMPMPPSPSRPGMVRPVTPAPDRGASFASPGFRRFSDSPAPNTETRGGVISRGAGDTNVNLPVVSEPPRPPSATSGNNFQNHPIGPIEVPIIVGRDPRSGNWTWHSGASGQNSAAPVRSGMTPTTPPASPQPRMGTMQPRMGTMPGAGAAVSPGMNRGSAPVMTRPSAPSATSSGSRSGPASGMSHAGSTSGGSHGPGRF